jgi:hypothetical protein
MDTDCAAGNYCDAGTCTATKVMGATCGGNSQCSSGFCADGVCCDGACSGACQACNLAGSGGTCSSVDPFTDDPMCMATETCDFDGQCKLKNGEACTMASQCASAVCSNGMCEP